MQGFRGSGNTRRRARLIAGTEQSARRPRSQFGTRNLHARQARQLQLHISTAVEAESGDVMVRKLLLAGDLAAAQPVGVRAVIPVNLPKAQTLGASRTNVVGAAVLFRYCNLHRGRDIPFGQANLKKLKPTHARMVLPRRMC